jgi:hypothetical protein
MGGGGITLPHASPHLHTRTTLDQNGTFPRPNPAAAYGSSVVNVLPSIALLLPTPAITSFGCLLPDDPDLLACGVDCVRCVLVVAYGQYSASPDTTSHHI